LFWLCGSYVVQEEDRRGKIDAKKVKAMGLPPGPIYEELGQGRDVTLGNGTVIKASEVRSARLPLIFHPNDD